MIKYITCVPDQFQKAHPQDAGYDIRAAEDVTINSRDRALIKTGLKVAIPEGYVGLICARSGLSVKHSLDIGAGVVDSHYRGDVGVCLINDSNDWYRVLTGDKIAQMVVIPICQEEVAKVESLDETERGANGFNSTGY